MPVWEFQRGWRGHLPLIFADLCDYTGLGERSDPEDVERLLTKLLELTTQVIERHDGLVVQVYGDGILAVFGLPIPKEGAPRAALNAALALHEVVRLADWSAVAPRDFQVQLHIGVHFGLVVAREGSTLRGRYDLTGDAVTTASRLCGAAGPGEVIASGAVLQGVEGFFEVTPLAAPRALKGKHLPVPAFLVTGRTASRTRAEAHRRRGLTTFVGRTPELAGLTEALSDAPVPGSQAEPARAKLVVVCGVAGIGKSRLLEEARARLSVLTLFGTCENHTEMAPLEPFRQVLRQLLGVLPALAPDHILLRAEREAERLGLDRETLDTLLSMVSTATPTQSLDGDDSELLTALDRLFAALTAQERAVLMLDDWQWADDTSRKFLLSLLRNGGHRRLWVVVATRDLDAVAPLPAHAQVVPLEPFDELTSARVVHALRPRDLDLGVTRALHRRAGGNPLFLEELCRALPEAPLDEEQLVRHGVPSSVQGVIQARLSTLPSDRARVLSLASVVGMEFTTDLLSRVLRGAALDDILDDLTRLDLIYATENAGTYRFKHGMARDVTYEAILKEDRKREHGAIAHAILEGSTKGALDAYAEALAYHFRGSHDHERAAEFAERAGAKALSTSTLDRARMHYRAALSELSQLPPSVEVKRRFLQVSNRWTNACVYGAARDQVVLLERAVSYADELGETGARAQTRYSLGWICYVLGDYDKAIVHYEEALKLATLAEAHRLATQLWANLGQSYAAAGRYAVALDHLGRSIAHKRAREAPSQGRVAQGFAYALGCRASVHSDMGAEDEAATDLQDALAMVGSTGHAVTGSVRALQAMTAIHRQAWAECREAATLSREISAHVSSAYVFATSSAYEAYASWKLTRDPKALLGLKKAVSWLEVRELGLFLSFAQACLADALHEADEREAAEAVAARALTRASVGDPLGEAMACRTLAKLNAEGEAADPARVAEYLERSRKAAEQRQSARELVATEQLRVALGVKAAQATQEDSSHAAPGRAT